MDALQKRRDGTLALETPANPRTGATLLVLDPLEWVHRITACIPDPDRHSVRYYGTYANQGRMTATGVRHGAERTADGHREEENSDFCKEVPSTWARFLKKVFETDPLICSCGAHLQIVSFITDPRVVERVLRHRQSERCKARERLEPRAPPRFAGLSLP
jgi:hypothetical protein